MMFSHGTSGGVTVKSRDTWRAASPDHLDEMNEREAKVLVSVVRLARPLTRKKTPKRVLALPDLEHAESAVLSRRRSVQRGYRTAGQCHDDHE